MKQFFIFIILATLSMSPEKISVLAVNSPQMIFYSPPTHDHYIHLESKYGYSATLSLRRSESPILESGSATASTNLENVQVSEFIVIGPEYPFYGVTAVIQEMNLRSNSKNQDCIDFVQFAMNSSDSERSSKICGIINRDEDWNTNITMVSERQRTFFSPEGRMHIYFYSDPTTPVLEEKEVGVEIVFTSYTLCPNEDNSWKKLEPCSKTEQMSCIYNTLFCDSKIDCGFPGEFGIDEQGCHIPYVYMTIAIVGSLLLTAILIYLFLRWVTKVPKEYR